MQYDSTSPRSILRLAVIIVAAIWFGFLFGYGGRSPNPLSQRVFDKALVVLPLISAAILALAVCRVCQWRVVHGLVIGLITLLFLGLFITISIWSVISVDNRTNARLTAVSVDLSNDVVRVVKVPPWAKRTVALTEGPGLESMAHNRYHVIVYDESGTIYRQETVRTGDVERIHVMTIDER
jgi:hypothetical protein